MWAKLTTVDDHDEHHEVWINMDRVTQFYAAFDGSALIFTNEEESIYVDETPREIMTMLTARPYPGAM